MVYGKLLSCCLVTCLCIGCTNNQANTVPEKFQEEVSVSALLPKSQSADNPIEPGTKTTVKEEPVRTIDIPREYDESKTNISHTIGVVTVKKYLEKNGVTKTPCW